MNLINNIIMVTGGSGLLGKEIINNIRLNNGTPQPRYKVYKNNQKKELYNVT